jgi:membrane protein YqaA with SNARE-associated domain
MITGLLSLFTAGLLAATLLPFGSEPVVVTYLLTQGPFTTMDRVWVVIAAGTGNTIGGAISYGMGRGAINIWQRYRSSPVKPSKPPAQQQKRSCAWLPVAYACHLVGVCFGWRSANSRVIRSWCGQYWLFRANPGFWPFGGLVRIGS